MKENTAKKQRRGWTLSNLTTALLAVFIVLMLLFPEVKATVLRGFMKIGFFKPDIPSHNPPIAGSRYPLVPAMEFTGTNNERMNLAGLGGKVIFINFWATWCPPCLAELPGIDGLYKNLAGDSRFVFILCDVDGDLAKSARFMKRHDFQLPLYRAEGLMAPALFSGTLPSTLVINKMGEITFHEQGVANYDTKKFEQYLRQLADQ